MSGKQPYQAEGDQVFKNPVTTDNGDGWKSVTLGFPVCTVSEWIEGTDDLSPAECVAGLLNQGQAVPQMLEALKAAEDILSDLPDDDGSVAPIRQSISAAIAAAEGTET